MAFSLPQPPLKSYRYSLLAITSIVLFPFTQPPKKLRNWWLIPTAICTTCQSPDCAFLQSTVLGAVGYGWFQVC